MLAARYVIIEVWLMYLREETHFVSSRCTVATAPSRPDARALFRPGPETARCTADEAARSPTNMPGGVPQARSARVAAID
jgi:hypothetical protein